MNEKTVERGLLACKVFWWVIIPIMLALYLFTQSGCSSFLNTYPNAGTVSDPSWTNYAQQDARRANPQPSAIRCHGGRR